MSWKFWKKDTTPLERVPLDKEYLRSLSRLDYLESSLNRLVKDNMVVPSIEVWFEKLSKYIPDIREEELEYCKAYLRRAGFRGWDRWRVE